MFAKFLRTSFLQNTSGRLFLLVNYQGVERSKVQNGGWSIKRVRSKNQMKWPFGTPEITESDEEEAKEE